MKNLEDIKQVRKIGGELYFLEDFGEDSNWNSEPSRKASEINPKAFEVIITKHKYAASVFFRPKRTDVLAQIPRKYLKDCDAIETTYLTDNPDSECHLAETKLYKKLK